MVRVVDRICDVLAVLAGIYLVGIMMGIIFQVAARSFGFSGSTHVFTFIEFGLLYIVMAGSPWLVRQKGHVFIELLTAALPAHVTAPFSRFVSALCVLLCLLLVWYTGEATWKSYLKGDADMRSIDMPRWLLLISMPICFSLMAIQFSRFVFGEDTLHKGEAGVHE